MAKTPVKNYQPSPKVLACRENGRKGGLARAKNVSQTKRREWSAKGGKTTIDTHGVELMSFISTKRKTVGRYRKPVKPVNINDPRIKQKKLKKAA